ncbi:hypothetical protein ACJIZ3_020765 [Penstemon smallii]|uniref:PsbQ-like protein 3, chloroplastic n=1 Tax=Penstemon smallii TaxID=265156 RepID=A0ABD3SJJ2_9LAMI
MASVAPPFLNYIFNRPTLIQTAPPPTKSHCSATRRSFLLLIFPTPLLFTRPTIALDLTMTVPDQTLEEAETGLQSHSKSLVKVKDLLTVESWKEAQKSLRRSSSLLKQDIYTIIQAKPPKERPRLRKLYSDLFNAVTRLDYAARDEDRVRVAKLYKLNTITMYKFVTDQHNQYIHTFED